MTKELFVLNFLYGLLATVIGGGVLAFLFSGSERRSFPSRE